MYNKAELIKSAYTGLIDHEEMSLEKYRPKLIVNNHLKGQKVLSSIILELKDCDEFFISVAFITQSGITTLLNTLQELEKRNIRGKIITSQYLNFTEPKALVRLLAFKNIELRILTDGNLHSKGYIFRKDNTYSLIVGSSNLTQQALGYNKEWNMKVSSMDKGSLIQETLVEFEETFQYASPVDLQWINEYSKIYSANKESQSYMRNQSQMKPKWSGAIYGEEIAEPKSEYRVYTPMLEKVMPNKMQLSALQGIEEVRRQGERKALIISATGTGKTYLSAFDVRKVKPKKFLFLAHREQILDQSIESYKRVLGEHIYYGKLCSGYKEIEADYLFSTIQSMAKESVLETFSRSAFDYIVLDESHRVGSETYQRILKYFSPLFLLGMTATPERSDSHNICQDFDYNIAYEIRLQEALKENMLCPFHYFGISEIEVDGQIIDEMTRFNDLVSKVRVDHIIEKIQFYGYHGNNVRGLIFCSRNNEAITLSKMFNERSYRTVALSGLDSQETREKALAKLEAEELDYIFTVDIFNEGVDIPCLNQVVMLRPTQSAIIFVQQLGRGLRKMPGKDYVVVLDFIGNYKNSFMIPMALSDDRSYNKDTIRRYTVEGNRMIPGCSTINFDEISRRKIYESIDAAKFSSVTYIKEGYKNLKFRLGRIPKLMDFEVHDSIDLSLLFSSSIGSYYEFLVKYEPEYSVRLDELKANFIQFISKKLAIGKRVHELLVLRSILESEEAGNRQSTDLMFQLEKDLTKDYNIAFSPKTVTNVVNMLTNGFTTGTAKNTYKECIFIEEVAQTGVPKPVYQVSRVFAECLKNPEFMKMTCELVELGFYRNSRYYGNRYQSTSLQLYQKYSYDDVCRLLEWEKGEVSLNIGGYKYDEASATYPVFINYHKAEHIESSIKYEDRFISPTKLIALSKSGRSIDSNDVQTALKARKLGIDMELFVRKNKDDSVSKEFYYLGKIYATGEVEPVIMEESGKKAVELTYQLETPVREDIYEYITEN